MNRRTFLKALGAGAALLGLSRVPAKATPQPKYIIGADIAKGPSETGVAIFHDGELVGGFNGRTYTPGDPPHIGPFNGYDESIVWKPGDVCQVNGLGSRVFAVDWVDEVSCELIELETGKRQGTWTTTLRTYHHARKMNMGRLISKVSNTQCGSKTCDFSGDVAFLASDDWKAPCPKCGAEMKCGQHPKFNPTHVGNRRFSGSGQLSIEQGCHPKEVEPLRRLMGQSADCIQSDGSVRFKDSKSEQRYRRDLARVKASIGTAE